MSYIGNSITQQSFTGGVDQYNGNNSNTAFGLTRTINTVYDVDVYVENVWQRPTTGYTVSANTITFTSAPPAGSNNVVVVYRNFSATSIVPQQGSVTTTALGNITIINAGPNAGMTLQTNNATVATLNANGLVGINSTGGTGSTRLQIDDSTGAGQVRARHSTGLGILINQASAGGAGYINVQDNASLVLSANNSDKMYVAANGNVGVAIATPLSTFHVEGQIRTSTSSNYATFNNNFLRSYAAGNYYFDNNTTGVDTVFRTSNASALDTTAMNVKANGVIDLPVGQIKFPATQNASSDPNTLDDYEEGTWTPTLRTDGTLPTVGYSGQFGVYTKIGNRVYVEAYLGWSSVSGGSGSVVIGGLPFASGYSAVDSRGFQYLCGYSGPSFSTVLISIVQATTTNALVYYNNNGSVASLTLANAGASGTFRMSFNYSVT